MRNAKADKDNDGKVSVDELYEFVQEHISKTEFKSHPQKWVWNLPEPIFLVNAPKPVFISYARENSDFADLLSQQLEKNGIATWRDTEGIVGGQDWLKKIASAVESARAVLFILSDFSLNSEWVRNELEFADRKGVPIIPVEFASCELPGWFELQFGRIQRHQVDKDNIEESMQSLIKANNATRRLRETADSP